MLEELYAKSHNFIKNNQEKYLRYFIKSNPFIHRLSIITGARGVGKTTSIAQYLNANYQKNERLFISLDDIELIGSYTMQGIAKEFVLNGGKILCFDEIHKYPTWSAELKNIYDNYDLKLIATGSSALHIHKGSHDLSRRAIVYEMFGMSFREFLELKYHFSFKTFSLQELLDNHEEIAEFIITSLTKEDKKVIALFKEFLRYGYYPYSLKMPSESLFFQTLRQTINTTLESDLLHIYPTLSGLSIKKIKSLLAFIMQSPPFEPNISSLQKSIQISDSRTLKEYLAQLDDSGLIKLLMPNLHSFKNLDKPTKIYLNNTNLMHLNITNLGALRECFFFNQLDNYYKINAKLGICASKMGDFCCEDKYIFEVGGKKKGFSQIKDIENSFVVSDDIEIGYKNKIPLWLFGFLY